MVCTLLAVRPRGGRDEPRQRTADIILENRRSRPASSQNPRPGLVVVPDAQYGVGRVRGVTGGPGGRGAQDQPTPPLLDALGATCKPPRPAPPPLGQDHQSCARTTQIVKSPLRRAAEHKSTHTGQVSERKRVPLSRIWGVCPNPEVARSLGFRSSCVVEGAGHGRTGPGGVGPRCAL